MGYIASSPEFRAYEENVFVATGGEKILPFRPADGFILVKNRQIQYPTVDWFINTDGKAELKTAATVGDTFLIINLASFLISGCATKEDIAGASNKPKFPLFDLTWRPSRASILDGTVPADGDTYSRAAYPDAFAAIQAGLVPVCTDAEWLADPSKRGFYTLGDGSTTFRVPDYNGKKTDAIASVVLRGDGKNAGTFGQVQQDCIREISGSATQSTDWGLVTNIARVSGAFSIDTGVDSPNMSGSGVTSSSGRKLLFKASNVVPTGPENRMTNVAGVWCIRLFNGRVLDGNVDLAALQTYITSIDSRVSSLESRKSTCLVNAVGTGAPHETVVSELPSNIVPGRKYVIPNPFGNNTPVRCWAEILVNGRWSETGWIYTGPNAAYGTKAVYSQGSGIVVVTATAYLAGGDYDLGSDLGISAGITTAPCRVFVTKI